MIGFNKMSNTEELYKEIIIEHSRNPSHTGHIDCASIVREGVNRSCGDEVSIELKYNQEKIEEIRVNSKGCSICVASGSVMAELVHGLEKDKAMALIRKFRQLLTDGTEEDLSFKEEDILAFKGVRKFPIRVKCATLVWSTLELALKEVL